MNSFYSQQNEFIIEGERYKRPLKTDFPQDVRARSDQLDDWYQRKSLYLVCNRWVEGQGIPTGWSDDLWRGFQTLAPLYLDLSSVAAST